MPALSLLQREVATMLPFSSFLFNFFGFYSNMNSVLDLNEPIVRRIFRYLISVPIYDIDTWKKYIPFLAVCQHWRYMIIDRVYRQAFINCFYYDGTGVNNHIVKTNIDLIVSCSWHNYAGSLSIILRDSSDFYETIDFLIERYIAQVIEWPKMCDLFITYDPNSMITIPMSEHVNVTTHNSRTRLIGEKFTRCIRNVQFLIIDNHTDTVIPAQFISTLIGSYGRNLRYLFCSGVSIPESLVYFSNELTCLMIRFSGSGAFYLPIILSKSLRTLELSGLPPNFLMSSLADCDKIRNIYFTSLHSLTLEYQKQIDIQHLSERITARHYNYTIYAPRLKVLRLEHAPRDFDLLHSFQKLRLDSFFFVGAIQSIEHLAIQSLDVSTRVDVKLVDSGNCSDGMFYNITNHHFSRFINRRKMILSIDCPKYNLDARLANWIHLNELTFTMPIHIITLLSMLKGLPNITKLDIGNLTSPSVENTLADIISALDMDFSPICPKLNIIYVRRQAAYNSVTHSQMIDTIVYLLVIAPTLRAITVFREFYDDVMDHIVRNTPHYPSFKNVHIYVKTPE